MYEVVSVKPTNDFRIIATFNNGEKRIADIKPLFDKPIFSFLWDISSFNRVYLKEGAVTWKDSEGDEVDICPDKLYMDSIPCSEGSA